MGTYRVRWEIDIDADTPQEAAEKALAVHRDPDSIATVFDVHAWGTDESVRVDLSESAWCVMVPDGTDTNGDVWNRCTVHGYMVLGDAYVCEGYRAPGYVERGESGE